MAGKLATSSNAAAKRALTEVEVGITEYICRTFPGFSGVIKKRFKDFIVHEVDLHGRVVRLTKIPAAKDKLKVKANGKGLSLGHNTKPDRALVVQGLHALAAAVNEDAAAKVKAILVGAGLYEEPVRIVNRLEGASEKEPVRMAEGLNDSAGLKMTIEPASSSDAPAEKKGEKKDAEGGSVVAEQISAAKEKEKEGSLGGKEGVAAGEAFNEASRGVDGKGLTGGKAGAEEEESPSMCILPAEGDKTKRTALHGIVREHFGGKLVTDTVNLDPSKSGADRVLAVRVVLQKKAAVAPRSLTNARASQSQSQSRARSRYGQKRKRGRYEDSLESTAEAAKAVKLGSDGDATGTRGCRKDGKIEIDWRSARDAKGKVERTRSERRARFLEFVLMKENTETHYVANKICRFLGDRNCKLSTAGTKDKRGVTTQKVVVTNCKADQVLRAVAKGFQRGNVVVGNFNVAKSTLRLGDLKGNHFTVVLRDVCSLDCDGDTVDVVASAEGRLESLKTKGFINYFGMQRFGSRKVSTFMIGRQVINGNMKRACELILQMDANDKDVIVRAKEMYANGVDLQEVIRAMPFYMTAENAILKGMQEHGRESYALAFKQVPWSLRTLYTHSYQSFVWNHMASLRMKMSPNTEPVIGDLVMLPSEEKMTQGNGDPRRTTSKDAKVKVLTEDDIASKKWGMADVVLPLPGYDVVYPTHEVNEQAYTSFIDNDGASSSFFSERKGDYRLPGSYRKVIAVPEDFEYEWMLYEDDEVDLALTDLDTLNHVKLNIKPGPRRALKCSFKLPQSTYATMVLREMMLTTTGLDAIKT